MGCGEVIRCKAATSGRAGVADGSSIYAVNTPTTLDAPQKPVGWPQNMSASIRRNISVLALIAIIAAAIYLGTGLRIPNSIQADATAVVSPEHTGKYHFLALGDSYTIGESVPPADRWPMQLANQIRSGGIDLGDPLIIARTGWTTGNLLAAMDAAKLTDKFDLITILIGVNNQFQGRSEDEYRSQFVELLHRAIALANGNASHVVVLSIPDWGVSPFGRQVDGKKIAAAIDRFNQINREETAKIDAVYVNITPSSRRAATQPDWFADDGLHPTRAQYGDWITAAIKPVRAALGG